jgi:hypothetical protein
MSSNNIRQYVTSLTGLDQEVKREANIGDTIDMDNIEVKLDEKSSKVIIAEYLESLQSSLPCNVQSPSASLINTVKATGRNYLKSVTIPTLKDEAWRYVIIPYKTSPKLTSRIDADIPICASFFRCQL